MKVFLNPNKRGLLLLVVLVADVLLASVLFCVLIRSDKVRKTSVGGEYIEPKTVALTFDDGPNEEYTGILLDGLRERGVKATFFLAGVCIEGNEELVRRMEEEGHLIGVHCMQHTQLTKESVQDSVEQLRAAKQMIEEILNETSEAAEGDAGEGNGEKRRQIEYVRPPFGAWNEELDEAVRTELSLEPVFWDVDSLDWELQNSSSIVRKVVQNAESGDVILMHDEFGTSVEAALEIIDNLMAKGYTFVTVNELMVD